MTVPIKSTNGFALIVSLVVMGFLMLLIVALGSFVLVEVQVADDSQMQARARKNAILGLNLALGELQRTTGADQRTTARADLQYPDDASQRKWVGAYGHALTPDYNLPPNQIAEEWTNSSRVDEQGSAAKLLSWLVSGNRSGNPQFTAEGQLQNPGYVPSLSFLPSASISNLSASTLARAADIEIQDSSGGKHPARILVGKGSVNIVEDFVVAPLVKIDDGEERGLIEGYAWWVGDENIKARANLAIETDVTQLPNAFLNASRTAIELMAQGEDGGDLNAARIGGLYNPHAQLEQVLSAEHLALLPAASDNDAFRGILKSRYHDLSVLSASLLTDSFAGGLKHDFGTLLGEAYAPSITERTANANPLWKLHPDDSSGYAVPTWGHLRSFAQTRVPSANPEIEARLPAFNQPGTPKSGYDDDVGVSPVLTYFSIGFGADLQGDTIHMNLYPVVVLWNPYNFTIKAPEATVKGANLEVGMWITGDVTVGIQILGNGTYVADDGTIVSRYWRQIAGMDFGKDFENSPASNQFKFIRFGLNCPDIPPGQSLVFVIPEERAGVSYGSYAVLENEDPVYASYTSVPVVTLDPASLASTAFRVGPFYSKDSAGNIGKKLSLSLLQYKESGGQAVGVMGGSHSYLGKPRDTRILADDAPLWLNPANSDLEWYQTIQNLSRTGTTLDFMDEEPVLVEPPNGAPFLAAVNSTELISVFQEPKPLGAAPEVAYVVQMYSLFSAKGTNGVLSLSQAAFQTRWIAQGNMRSTRHAMTRRDQNYLPLYTSTGGNAPVVDLLRFQPASGEASARASAGSGHDADGTDDSPVDAVLFEFLPEDQPLFSIGQLQHANLSFVGSYPSYPIGNSLADFRLHEKSKSGNALQPAEYQLARTDNASGITKFMRSDMQAYYDISYLLNRNLWDSFFFSTIPQSGAIPENLPNKRMHHDGSSSLRSADLAAAHLVLEGGFNINSTSEQAWRAVLGGIRGIKYDPVSQSESNTPLAAVFSRFSRPTADDSQADPWQGYRSLSDDEIAQLARNIVTEIKNRGPFISLGDFVNRRLLDNPATKGGIGGGTKVFEYEDLSGTIQAAIDRTWISGGSGTGGTGFPANDSANAFWSGEGTLGHPHWSNSGQFGSGGGYAYDLRRIIGGDAERKPVSNRSAFAPGYLTQADVLSAIGAGLSARSDTFVIRAYGETVSVSAPDNRAVAWCEAVVQRMPEYVDSIDKPEDAPSSVVNQTLGRRYRLISFRWLNEDEI